MLNEKLPQYWNVKMQTWTNDESEIATEFNAIFKERLALSRDLNDVIASRKAINQISKKYNILSLVDVADITHKLENDITVCNEKFHKLAQVS